MRVATPRLTSILRLAPKLLHELSLDGKGTLARSNAELVEKVVRIAREVGREIATPEEARKITGLTSSVGSMVAS